MSQKGGVVRAQGVSPGLLAAGVAAGAAVGALGAFLLQRSCQGAATAGKAGPGTSNRTKSPPAETAEGCYARFLTRESAKRQPSAIRALMPLVRLPGMISLGGGMPNPALFPFRGMEIELDDEAGTKVAIRGKDLDAALQYSPTPGLPPLVWRLCRLMVAEHTLPAETLEPGAGGSHGLCIGAGSQDLLAKAFHMLLAEGDSVLVEAATYSGSLASLEPIGVKVQPVASDADGMDMGALASLLAGWDEASQGRRPRVVYVIPNGCNPTGASLADDRRRRLLDIAEEFDLLIIEDDPYYFLQFGARSQSLLSLDAKRVAAASSGAGTGAIHRVLRFDSLSKVLSSGLRIGFCTAPLPLLERITLDAQASCLHTSGLSQAAVLALFAQWGVGDEGAEDHMGGLRAHLERVVAFYKAQRDAFVDSATRHLVTPGLATFATPTAGMFVWMRLNGVPDSRSVIMGPAREAKVLMVPGSAFVPGFGQKASPFVRAAYSLASPENMEEAMRRFAECLQAFQREQSPE